MTETAPVAPRSESPWLPAAQQQAFRCVMNCFAYPGRIGRLEAAAEHALSLLLATLVDAAVRLADPQHLLAMDQHRRLGARPCRPEEAQFVLWPGWRAPAFEPMLGTLESPEQGATLVVTAEALSAGAGLRLSGPGIDGETSILVRGVDPAWWPRRAQWNAAFPLGVDMIVIAGRHILGLPRTTRIDVAGED